MATLYQITQSFLQKEIEEAKILKSVWERTKKKKSMFRIKTTENKSNPTENKGSNFST